MDMNRSNAEAIERYGKKKTTVAETRNMLWIKTGICLFLYGLTIFTQFQFQSLFGINMGGIAAQFQVMISTYLVIFVKKHGYPIAVAMNMVESVLVAFLVIRSGNMNATPGVIVPLCTIITISIISYYGKGLDAKLEEISRQKQELSDLYEDLTTSQNEIIKQRILMTEYNQEMNKREIRQSYFAYIDILTELPNRKMIIEKLDHFAEIARNKKISFAVVFMDLDDFKSVNTARGYHIGDLLLKEIVIKMKSIIHDDDILGRLDGDEFVLIIHRDLKEAEIYDYAERISSALSERFVIEKMEINISASFGISIFPRDGLNSEELLNHSHTALLTAKENSRSQNSIISEE
jgi:diguanylate cyclase (GGDEF)-like protein